MNQQTYKALVAAVDHYLDRMEQVLNCVAAQPDAEKFMKMRLAPDMFDTGLHFAIPLQFAVRAICPPAGRDVPEIPNEYTPNSLLAYKHETARAIRAVPVSEMTNHVVHRAGQAELNQAPDDYIARFALPNMIFHFSMAYAALRQAGMELGKSDFDGLHVY